MKKLMMTAWTNLTTTVKNERGSQSLEWLGIAALLILVLGILSQALKGQEGSIGELVGRIVSKIGAMVGE